MDLRKLRYFVAVAEEMHFRRAAERLNMSQPPLSQHIRRLEDEVGAQLFIRRTNTQVRLTPAGEKLLKGVRLAIEQAERATSDARRAAMGELGILRVGYTREFVHEILPSLISRYNARYPGVMIELVSDHCLGMLNKVYCEEVDIALLHQAPLVAPEGLHTLSIGQVPLLAALSSLHPLAGRQSVSWRELFDTPFLLPRTTEASAEGIKATFFEHAGYVPKVAAMFTNCDILAEMVGRGMGWTIGTMGSFNSHDPRISLIRLVEPEAKMGHIAAWRPSSDKATIQGFVSELEAMMVEAPPRLNDNSEASVDDEKNVYIAAE